MKQSTWTHTAVHKYGQTETSSNSLVTFFYGICRTNISDAAMTAGFLFPWHFSLRCDILFLSCIGEMICLGATWSFIHAKTERLFLYFHNDMNRKIYYNVFNLLLNQSQAHKVYTTQLTSVQSKGFAPGLNVTNDGNQNQLNFMNSLQLYTGCNN